MRHLTILMCVAASAALVLPSCVEKLGDDCENTATCASEGDGDHTTATGGNGGDGDGDTGGSGASTGGRGDGGAPPSGACDPVCTGSEVCKEAGDTGTCVECLETDDCTDALCDTATNTCAECLENADCGADAPVCSAGACEGCSTSTDCEDRSGTTVCESASGACVECLSEADCSAGTKVCDPAANTCTALDARALSACQECVHDAQCAVGQLCVEQVFDSEVVGNFCTWRKDGRPATVSASCFSAGEPYAGQPADPVTSVDGASAVLCTLRSTSCPAFLQHSQLVTGCTDETPTSDDACGATDLDDGLCRQNTGGDSLCTYPCRSAEDCSGSTTTCVGAPDGYCSL